MKLTYILSFLLLFVGINFAFAQPHSEFSLTRSSGCINTDVEFTNLSTGVIASYNWDFGDGTNSEEMTPTHLYDSPGTFTITLTVEDGDGLSDFFSRTYTVRQPAADFNFAPSHGCSIPTSIFFTDLSTLPDTWNWSFGDGGTSRTQNPIHTYSTGGEFTIVLTVSDTNNGCVDRMEQTLRIGSPDAIIDGSSHFGCGPFTVNYTESSVNTGFGEITDWYWDFGDGTSSDEREPTHIYEHSGIYSVSLTVTNSLGCTKTDTKSNFVQVIGPETDFSSDIEFAACPDLTVNFTDHTVFGSPPTSWNWNFGDGSTSTLQNPIHTFTDYGEYDISLIVSDLDGCSRAFTQSGFINIKDTIPPTFDICPTNQTGSLSASCDFEIIDYSSLATVSDNCTDLLTIIQTPAPGTLISSNQLISLQVTDESDSMTTCSFNLNLIDEIAPTIICPENQRVSFDEDCSYTLLDYTNLATANDNCLAPIITQSPAAGTIITSTQTIILTSTDTASNAVSCSFDVIPTDVTVPTINCPEDISTNNDSGVCGATITYLTPVGIDNCAPTTILSEGLASGSIFPIGTTTNTFVVTDEAGLEAECSFDITVFDIEDPTITCPINQLESLSEDCDFVLPDYTALAITTDNCGDDLLITQSPTAGTIITSETIITLSTVDASSNEANCTFTVFLIDEINPIISCPENQNVSFDEDCAFTLVDYTSLAIATDNCLIPTILQSPAPGTIIFSTTTIMLTATDTAGNVATCSFDVIPVDDTPPTISCPADITVNNDPGICGGTVTYATPIGEDNCSATTIITDGFVTGSIFPIGLTLVNYRVNDEIGLTATCSFNVTVIDNEIPELDCPPSISIENDPTVCGANVAYDAPLFNDNCADPIFSQIAGLTSGALYPIGTTINSFELVDASGNVATCSFEIEVIDTENPSIVCPENITTCDSIITIPDIIAVDNCAVARIELISGIASGDIFPLGITTNMYEAIDIHGNSDLCTMTIERFEIPTINAGTDQTINAGFAVELNSITSIPITYQWTPPIGLSETDIQNPIANPEQTTLYTIIGTTENGCTATDEILVNVSLEIEINNFISPNGDNKNDTWQIKGHYLLGNCSVKIIDSWGHLIYENKGYDNMWDGTHEGRELQAGNYYYIIDCSDGQPETGSITLIR